MYRSIGLALTGAATLASLWSMAPRVYAQDAQTDSARSAEQVRAALGNAGYQVGEAHTWTWMQPPFSAFRMSDAATDRVWTVVVYPDPAAANEARLHAADGQSLNETVSNEPRLVIGFGPSVWYGNVALVQSTESRLGRLYLLQTDRDNGVYDAADPTIERPDDAVDLDVRNALVNSAVNL